MGVYIGNNTAVLPKTIRRLFIYIYNNKSAEKKIVLKIHTARIVSIRIWNFVAADPDPKMDPDPQIDVRFCCDQAFTTNSAKLYLTLHRERSELSPWLWKSTLFKCVIDNENLPL